MKAKQPVEPPQQAISDDLIKQLDKLFANTKGELLCSVADLEYLQWRYGHVAKVEPEATFGPETFYARAGESLVMVFMPQS